MRKHLKPKYKKHLPNRGRGLDELEVRVGDIPALIESVLVRKRRARILELGCGYGFALMQLDKVFGKRVELFGINKKKSHGDWRLFRQVAYAKGLCSKEELDRIAPISITYANVGRAIPFPNDYFDVVFSQASFMYYGNKARCLEEINRVLDPSGTACIDVNVERKSLPVEYATGFEIWNNHERTSFWSFITKFKSLTEKRRDGKAYLEMKKTRTLNLGLRLVSVIDLNDICDDWFGTKSVYRI